MSGDTESAPKAGRCLRRPFTRESLATIEARIAEEHAKKKEPKKKRAGREYDDKDKGPQPDPTLEQGEFLPVHLQSRHSSELAATPIEDIDSYYHNQKTFVVISKGNVIFRFSATNALWILDPFNPIRRLAVCILVHPLFSFLIFTTILVNFLFMMLPVTPIIISVQLICIGIYTFELVVKVLARGFILQPFTYLRDPWNWLDLVLIALGYLTLAIDLGNWEPLRTMRVLRALKTVAILPRMKTIIGAIAESLKNLLDVVILIMFFLFVLAVLGLQMYMGILTQRCIRNFPTDGSWGNLTDASWITFNSNSSNWYDDDGEYPLCGNSSGAGLCPEGYTCLQGFGDNPNYGYTSFDTFGWAFLSAFRLMTQDFWEDLYQLVLRSAGPWHMLFFIAVIFLGSFYLVNLILAIVVVSYDQLQKKAEKEKATEDEVIRKAEEAALVKENKNAAAAASKSDESDSISEHGGRTNGKARKESSLESEDGGTKTKHHQDNPFIEPIQHQTVVDIKDVMVLNDIIEQAAGRQSAASEHGDEGEGPKLKEKTICNKVIDLFCIWDCCWPWRKFQEIVAFIAFDPFFELFITLCIVLNTLFMALDHHDIHKDMAYVLKIGNHFFVATFAIEVTMKIIAMSPKYYFQERWNIFDFVIVALALFEWGMEGVQGLSILRAFRLLRVFKLARSWPTLNRLLSIMDKTVGALVNLTIVLFIITSIFAEVGMHFFGRNYIENIDRFPDEELPRWNFVDFMHSFMVVFRAICGEWIESMWDCMLVGDVSCIPFFLAVVVIGNFVVLKLFLALLLSNFGSSNLSAPAADKDTKRIAEAFARIGRFINWVKGNSLTPTKLMPAKPTNQISDQMPGEGPSSSWKELDDGEKEEEGEDGVNRILFKEGDIHDGANEDTPAECCPDHCYKRLPFLAGDNNSPFWQGWSNLRLKTFQVVKNKYFENAIFTTIILSSLALALEDVHLPQRPILQDILYYMDKIVTVIFFLEMLIKWLALGFKKYFTNGWCLLDFVIVVVSLINFVASLVGAGDIQVFRTMKILRVLWPLKPTSGMQRMRVVVNALAQAIPNIFNAVLICFMVWLIFAIMGVQLFAGKYYKCVDEYQTTFSYDMIADRSTCIDKNYTWVNSPMNFDHVGNAYLSLLQVATFKGWIQIMNDAIDSREVNKQPIRETNIYMYLYFVFFIIFGSFFTLNLFIGVIVDKFNEQKKKAGGYLEVFMTEDQKKYYSTMKKIRSKKPLKAIPRPKWKLQSIIFDIVTNKKFEIIMMVFIGFFMLTLSFDHYKQTEAFSTVLDYLYMIFIVIFSIECLMKIFALRYHYFKEPWNLYEFVVVILLILGLVMSDLIEKYFVSPTLLVIVRVAKVGQVLRLVKGAKVTRTLHSVLAMSLPALFNICLLLFLVIVIYAIFGMSFFMHVKNKSGLDDVYNFKTFGQSMILLFQISTLAGWDGVLDSIMNEEDCELPDIEMGFPGNCGSSTIAIIFLVSYLLISFFTVINMFIAVILENYSQATKDAQEGLTDNDYDMYYKIWQQFDPDGTQYIRYDQLSDFLDALEPPFQIPKPNKYKIVSMDIPICKGDLMFCVDILDALTKDFFACKGNPIKESAKLGEDQAHPNEVGYKPVSSTLCRQREESCARLIQNAWRTHKSL